MTRKTFAPTARVELSLQEMLDALPWEELTKNSISCQELDAMIRANGQGPHEFDYLYK